MISKFVPIKENKLSGFQRHPSKEIRQTHYNHLSASDVHLSKTRKNLYADDDEYDGEL